MEYVPNGKLQSYLRHSRAQRYYDNMHGSSSTLTSRDLTSFCYQIAKGMQYLSSKGVSTYSFSWKFCTFHGYKNYLVFFLLVDHPSRLGCS